MATERSAARLLANLSFVVLGVVTAQWLVFGTIANRHGDMGMGILSVICVGAGSIVSAALLLAANLVALIQRRRVSQRVTNFAFFLGAWVVVLFAPGSLIGVHYELMELVFRGR